LNGPVLGRLPFAAASRLADLPIAHPVGVLQPKHLAHFALLKMTYGIFAQVIEAGGPESGSSGDCKVNPKRGCEAAMTDEITPIPGPLNNVIKIDDDRIKGHLDRVVPGTVEETLNALLDAEADRICNAQRYERTEARHDTRAGHYERGLETKAGPVTLKVPKLRRQTFETAIIERYRRREASVEEALIEMYLADVSVRRVEDITEALWGTRVLPSTVSDLNKKIYEAIDVWRNRPIEGCHPYVYLDGIVMKRSWAGEVRNVSLLVAIAVNAEGYREILGICEGAKEDLAGWPGFLKHLKDRGLQGVRMIISDACMGLAESAAEFCPDASWQRCNVGSLKKLAIADSFFLAIRDWSDATCWGARNEIS
jgi:Transposase, Mutator family